eukprot:3153395-Karenia_brevis.AAC.1
MMSLEWDSVWEAKVTIFHVLKFRERGRLSARADNELRVGLSMGSKSNDFPYILEAPGAGAAECARRT